MPEELTEPGFPQRTWMEGTPRWVRIAFSVYAVTAGALVTIWLAQLSLGPFVKWVCFVALGLLLMLGITTLVLVMVPALPHPLAWIVGMLLGAAFLRRAFDLT
jgi:hypothetical protein